MSKLAIIGVVIAVLTATATAAGGRGAVKAHPRSARTCFQSPIFAPGKNATACGPGVFRGGITIWVRDPATGAILPVPSGKWRTEVGPFGP